MCITTAQCCHFSWPDLGEKKSWRKDKNEKDVDDEEEEEEDDDDNDDGDDDDVETITTSCFWKCSINDEEKSTLLQ